MCVWGGGVVAGEVFFLFFLDQVQCLLVVGWGDLTVFPASAKMLAMWNSCVCVSEGDPCVFVSIADEVFVHEADICVSVYKADLHLLAAFLPDVSWGCHV